MMIEQPTVERMQEVLHSPFDIETHKQTFTSYLEVVIDSEGNVFYAIPSHSEKLKEIAMEKLEMSEDELGDWVEKMVKTRYGTIAAALCDITGCVSVWFDGYIGEPNDIQLAKLKEFFDNLIYMGPITNVPKQRREEYEQFMRTVGLIKDIAGDLNHVCETLTDADE